MESSTQSFVRNQSQRTLRGDSYLGNSTESLDTEESLLTESPEQKWFEVRVGSHPEGYGPVQILQSLPSDPYPFPSEDPSTSNLLPPSHTTGIPVRIQGSSPIKERPSDPDLLRPSDPLPVGRRSPNVSLPSTGDG